MITRLRRIISLLLLCAFLPLAQAAGEPLPMWEIRSPASKGAVYLLGSIHVCRESCLQFSESILQRFRNSQTLAIELDPAANPDEIAKFMAGTRLPPGQTLSSKLSATQLARLRTVCEGAGLSFESINNMTPMWASGIISATAILKQGLSTENGIDLWFLQQARKMDKPVRELETAERQLAAMQGGTERDQLQSLFNTVSMIEKGRAASFLEEMITAWQNGDLTRLDQLIREDADPKSIEVELLDKRNVEMANKISVWLKQGEQVFIVIGAAHITGSNSVAALLAKKGFTIRQIHNGE